MIKKEFNFVDLFAGIGGIRLAFEEHGGKCIFSSEIDKNAQITYESNFGEKPHGDIKLCLDLIPKHDILVAGFPCQSFSLAGYRLGFEDEARGTFFFDLATIIEKYRPKAFLFENVKGLVNHDKGKTFDFIIKVLENSYGYRVFYKILNTATHTNIPQNRERIFIVGFDPKQVNNFDNFEFPEEIPLTVNMHDILDSDQKNSKYYYKNDNYYFKEINQNINSKEIFYQFRRYYLREIKSGLCPTLTANMGTGGHNVPIIMDDFGIRKLIPKECFRLQGFPENFILPKNVADGKLYQQIGNSVTVPLVSKVAKKMLEVF